MNLLRYIAAILLLNFMACKNEPADQEAGQPENKTSGGAALSTLPESGSLSGDTLNINGKFVLFFGPVETKEGQKTPADQIMAFKATSAALIDSLATKTDIKAVYSTAAFFRIYTNNGSKMIISKSALNEEAGLLMNDGNQPPTIKKGIQTSNEYYKQIRQYFFMN